MGNNLKSNTVLEFASVTTVNLILISGALGCDFQDMRGQSQSIWTCSNSHLGQLLVQYMNLRLLLPIGGDQTANSINLPEC